MRRRIAVVVTRCAPEIYGGAERYAFALAAHARATFDVELLTTTAHDYMTWQNAYDPGVESIEGLTVRRFRVDEPRDVPRFDRLSERLMRARAPALAEQERWMGEQGPLSLDLLRYLASAGATYDAVVFVGYLYATTYFGLPLVATRAALVPLTHDEWPLRFSMWERIFALPRAFLFNAPEERAFTQQRFPRLAIDGPVLGTGIDGPPPGTSAERFRARTGIDAPFALYLGRIDPSKGCRELLRAYARGRPRIARDLVLIGDRQLDVPPIPGVHVLGPLDEAAKWDALLACDLVVQPSRHESLSIVALEAWAAGKPVVANARSAVLAGQIERSGGGVAYDGDRRLIAALGRTDPAADAAMGARGRAFVDRDYRWPAIEARFARHLALTFGWPDDQSSPA